MCIRPYGQTTFVRCNNTILFNQLNGPHLFRPVLRPSSGMSTHDFTQEDTINNLRGSSVVSLIVHTGDVFHKDGPVGYIFLILRL